MAGRHLLLGDDGDAGGGGAKGLDDDQLGGVVGLGDRAGIGFPGRREAAGADGEDYGPGPAGEVGGEGQQRRVVHRRHQTTAAPPGQAGLGCYYQGSPFWKTP